MSQRRFIMDNLDYVFKDTKALINWLNIIYEQNGSYNNFVEIIENKIDNGQKIRVGGKRHSVDDCIKLIQNPDLQRKRYWLGDGKAFYEIILYGEQEISEFESEVENEEINFDFLLIFKNHDEGDYPWIYENCIINEDAPYSEETCIMDYLWYQKFIEEYGLVRKARVKGKSDCISEKTPVIPIHYDKDSNRMEFRVLPALEEYIDSIEAVKVPYAAYKNMQNNEHFPYIKGRYERYSKSIELYRPTILKDDMLD